MEFLMNMTAIAEANNTSINHEVDSMDIEMEHDQMNMMMEPTDAFCTNGMMSTTSHHLGGGQTGMIMYMDGFRLSLKGNQPCLNLFFPSWTLDTYVKFVCAMIGIVMLGIVTEGVSKARFIAQHRLKASPWKKSIISVLHGLQAMFGYVLMLATMTFSVELLFCVIIGLGLGFVIFYDEHDRHVTTNPCCSFMQSESDERIEDSCDNCCCEDFISSDDDGYDRHCTVPDTSHTTTTSESVISSANQSSTQSCNENDCQSIEIPC